MTNEIPSPELLYRALGATLKVAEAFPADALGRRPAPGMMTVAEIIDHVAFNLEYVTDPIASWLNLPEREGANADARIRLADANARVRQVFNAVPQDQWLAELTYPDGYSMSIVRAALVMLEHDAHHRGELVVVLRTLGIDPPKRWSGS